MLAEIAPASSRLASHTRRGRLCSSPSSPGMHLTWKALGHTGQVTSSLSVPGWPPPSPQRLHSCSGLQRTQNWLLGWERI